MNKIKGSVWLKEVETALVKLVKDTVQVTDEIGNPMELSVLVRDPQKEAKITQYPCVSIYNYNQVEAKDRVDNQTTTRLKYKDSTKTKIIMDKVSKPYYLYYQIDFFAKYQTDIDDMTRQWLGSIDRNTVLEVRDTNNNKRYCNMVEQPYKHNRTSGTIYQKSYTYKVWVELDESKPYEVATVITVDVRR